MTKINFVISKDGTKIFYKYSRNNNNKNTIMIINYIGYNTTFLEKTFNYFIKNNCSILIFDIRCHGNSSKGKIEIDRFIEDMEAIIRKEKINRLYLIGLCLSSKIAIQFFFKHKKTVKKLFLSTPPLDNSYTIRSKIYIQLAKLSRYLIYIKPFIRERRKKTIDYNKYKKPLSILRSLAIIHQDMSLMDFFEIGNILFNLPTNIKNIDIQIYIYLLRKDEYIKFKKSNYLSRPNIHIVTKESSHYKSEPPKGFKEYIYKVYKNDLS